ncbi:LOW QUALITY PROTEIN: uncharacterized protein LOC141510822 [Macrotis lagotis]|uniref:LOW QUALITY PROTEIN: uncharacterized protein LOC141510822 n=1 Tax=Macrotis lagotis TaxID=92651 RepID=UPI003D68F198
MGPEVRKISGPTQPQACGGYGNVSKASNFSGHPFLHLQNGIKVDFSPEVLAKNESFTAMAAGQTLSLDSTPLFTCLNHYPSPKLTQITSNFEAGTERSRSWSQAVGSGGHGPLWGCWPPGSRCSGPPAAAPAPGPAVAGMFAMGCSMGPFLPYWHQWLDKLFPAMGFKGIRTIRKKVLVAQLVASLLLGVQDFLGMGCLVGQGLDSARQELQEKFWEIYKADWCLWPAAQLVNFLYVPTHYQEMYVNSMTLGWDTYLSYLKHRDCLAGHRGLASHLTELPGGAKHLAGTWASGPELGTRLAMSLLNTCGP